MTGCWLKMATDEGIGVGEERVKALFSSVRLSVARSVILLISRCYVWDLFVVLSTMGYRGR